MKVAVTGASGFVGRHVLAALAEVEDAEVVAVSRSPLPADRLRGNARHVALDLGQATANDYQSLGAPDVLIHLAWGGLPNYLSLHHFEAELPVQYRFLKAMVEGGLKSLLVTGTCYEYGMLSGELSEEMAAPPANPYAYAKIALHRQLQFLQAEVPFDLTWARLFYMWGEGQAPSSIYPSLLAAAERGDETFPMSQGEQLRDYLPVAEVAALLAMLTLRQPGAGLVNVCSGEPISIRRLVSGWIAQHGWRIRPEFGLFPYSSYEPLAFWGSRARLQDLVADRS